MSLPAVFEVDPRALAPEELAAYIRWVLSLPARSRPCSPPSQADRTPRQRGVYVEGAT